MTSTRRVLPELLDSLPASDPQAQRARRDLRRVNAWMGNARIVARALQALPLAEPPRRVVEIGAGDGTFLLQVARLMQPKWPAVEVILVDQQELLDKQTAAAFQQLGWRVTGVRADAAEWFSNSSEPEIVVANLFLHHFEDAALRALFRQLAGGARAIVACEPRRFAFPWLAGNLVSFIGCNSVTRHDAVASVRAGFVGRELSVLWPTGGDWEVMENEAGFFSHSFVGHRACTAHKLDSA